MPRRMATRNAGGYRAARVVFLEPSNSSRSRHRGPGGCSPSFVHRRPTRFSASGAELAQRDGFRTSGLPTPARAGSEIRIPKRHTWQE
eukprot:4761344-Alexandrium_andersonii.AAC.1